MLSSEKNLKENRTYVVKKIDADGSIQLSEGHTIKMLGVRINRENAGTFLQDLLVGKKIICEKDSLASDENAYYIYVWGQSSKFWQKHFEKDSLEFSGFLNVADGFGSPKKGLALFLNATLIKSGWGIVDESIEFKLKNQFKKKSEHL